MKPFYLIDNVEDIFVFLHSEARNAQITFLEKVQKNAVGFQNMFLWVPL